MKQIKYPMDVTELNEYLNDPKVNSTVVAILWLAQQIQGETEPDPCEGCPIDN